MSNYLKTAARVPDLDSATLADGTKVTSDDRNLHSWPNKLAWTTVSTSSDLAAWKETDAAGFASNFDNAFFGVGSFIGDYINVAVVNGKVYAVFTGVNTGKNDSDIFIFITG